MGALLGVGVRVHCAILSAKMVDLPTETLLLILSNFTPHFQGNFSLTSFGSYSTDINDAQYLSHFQILANLRLVCTQWYHSITPFLYSTFILFIQPRGALLRQTAAFRAHPEFIHHLIICGKPPPSAKLTPNRVSGRFNDAELLKACIGECTSLRTLHLAHTEHIFSRFPPSDVLRLFQSNRSTLSNLTSVVIRNDEMEDPRLSITQTLIGLGPAVCSNLTSLEIASDFTGYYHTLSLPSSFPSVSHLCLRWRYSIPSYYLKLLSRIVCKVPTPNNATKRTTSTPLRSLTLESIECTPSPTALSALLTLNNVGALLDSLNLHMRCSTWVSPSVYQEIGSLVFKLCPSLTSFHYFAFFSPLTLKDIPPQLEELGVQVTTVTGYVLMRPRTIAINLEPIIDWVRSRDISVSEIGRSDSSIGCCGFGLKRLVVTFVRRDSARDEICAGDSPCLEDWETLERECRTRGLSLIRSRE
ncbi:hypothetical protein AX16_005435 [Volvariella volvacea WC 439]|nr:hypothetical protein AX16_005435 [Volvariella volvacea WC 439]